jgi:hypothetical protein
MSTPTAPPKKAQIVPGVPTVITFRPLSERKVPLVGR